MRNRGSKYIVLFALLISVAAVSLGFAAFTSTLTISSSAAVNFNQPFDLKFSTANNKIQAGTVTPTATGATGASATIPSDSTSITGLKATFTSTGQSVKYTFYAYNASPFVGYLNSVNFGTKTCTAKSGTTQSYVNNACGDISLTVKAGSSTFTSSNTNISSHTVASAGYETIEVTIAYAANGAVADGDFDVTFGDVTLIYGTAD